MHKKVIRGVTYYYTTVRENGKIKTIYLGRTRSEARKREAELKGVELKSSRPWIYFGLAVLIIVAFFLSGAIIGYLVSVPEPIEVTGKLSVEVTLQAGGFLPRDVLIEVYFENQTSTFTLEEFLENSGSDLTLEENDFYSSDIQLTGSGEGYGIKGTKKTYPEVDFRFELTAYTESGLDFEIFNASCSFEKPYLVNASNLLTGENYSVSLVPGSIRIGNKTLDDSYVFLELRGDLILAETSYSETLEGYGIGFTGESRTFTLNLSELGMEIPEVPGEYTVVTKAIYNGSILEETSKAEH